MPPHHAVPAALRPIVLLARMRDRLPPAKLADLLATWTPPIDPAGAAWTDLCAALDAYDHAAEHGLDLDEARYQVNIAAMILNGQGDGPDIPTLSARSHTPRRRPSHAGTRLPMATRPRPPAPGRGHL